MLTKTASFAAEKHHFLRGLFLTIILNWLLRKFNICLWFDWRPKLYPDGSVLLWVFGGLHTFSSMYSSLTLFASIVHLWKDSWKHFGSNNYCGHALKKASLHVVICRGYFTKALAHILKRTLQLRNEMLPFMQMLQIWKRRWMEWKVFCSIAWHCFDLAYILAQALESMKNEWVRNEKAQNQNPAHCFVSTAQFKKL